MYNRITSVGQNSFVTFFILSSCSSCTYLNARQAYYSKITTIHSLRHNQIMLWPYDLCVICPQYMTVCPYMSVCYVKCLCKSETAFFVCFFGFFSPDKQVFIRVTCGHLNIPSECMHMSSLDEKPKFFSIFFNFWRKHQFLLPY